MKTVPKIKILALVFLLFANCHVLIAAGGDDHTHGNEKPTASGQQQRYFSSEAVSDKYELLLRYEPIHIGEAAHLILFVSEYATNKPVDKAEIKISAQEDGNLVFTAKQTDEGTYLVETTFPEKKKYSLVISINSVLGADLILLSNIEAGKELPHVEGVNDKSIFSNWQLWLAIIIALAMGLGIGMLLQKRNTATGKKVISCVLFISLFSIPVENSIAHGDDDHGANKSGNNFSNAFNVPKETQFLFDVFTEKVQAGSFTESTKLFGTIIPSSNGQALVTTPQNGKIVSLSVKVGEQIKSGQQLALIEQNIDAASQINMMAEKNNLSAEYDAAKKEFDRLNSIKDIAAKKMLTRPQPDCRKQKPISNYSTAIQVKPL